MALDTAVGRTGGDGEGPTLERLLSAMGAGALEPLLVPRGLGVVVEGIAVLDPMEPGPRRGRLLLAVGVDPQSAAAVDVVRDAAGAAAVVFGPGGRGGSPTRCGRRPRTPVRRCSCGPPGAAGSSWSAPCGPAWSCAGSPPTRSWRA
ncbi:hypothetical protein LUX05_10520 [Streptomyces somaliensis]|nr:hypothetical protein [Streptomyces somaliensis]